VPPSSSQPASIGPYAVEREIGRGGMGVVYLARDGRLDRAVAIKALPQEFAADPLRLARFQREARVVASLSHPNIAAVYGLEEATVTTGGATTVGSAYIVMEYVDGPTLADRLANGPLPLDEAIAVAAQVAAGVEAAHEAGVIHRDLKPANIKLTADGKAKVLDFGLAREIVPMASRGSHDPLATLTHAPMTNAGAIMGTVGYMAPEQARGRTVDRRADIFAFGCVLFEMLTGKPPFTGPTQADVLAAVLEREADLSKLPGRTPPSVRELIARCLEKDPNRRLRDIGEARIILQEAVDRRLWSSTSTGLKPARARFSWRRAALPAAALLGGAGLTLAALWAGGVLRYTPTLAERPERPETPERAEIPERGTRSSEPDPTSRLSIVFPDTLTPVFALQLSPDGRTVGYIAEVTDKPGTPPISTVCIRALDRYEPRRLPGTDHAINLNYAVDGQSVLIVTRQADDQGERAVWSVPIDGVSPPVRLMVRAPLPNGLGASIQVTGLPGGDVLVTDQTSREFIRLRAGRDAPVSRVAMHIPERTDEVWPRELLPDGRTLLCTSSGYADGIYAVASDLYDLETGKFIKRLAIGQGQQYHDGLIYFLRERTMMVSRFDLERLELMGDPVPIETSVQAVPPISFRVSRDGHLGYRAAWNRQEQRSLGIFDTSGRITPTDATRRAYISPPLVSLDGKRFVTSIERTDRLYEVWGGITDQPTARKLYSIPGFDAFQGPLSPSGDRFFVGVTAGQNFEIRVARTDNPADATTLISVPARSIAGGPAGWSANPDKFFLSYGEGATSGITRTVLVDARTPQPDLPKLPSILPGGAVSREVATSPDGRWIAYSPVGTMLGESYLVRWENDQPVGEPFRIPVGTLEKSVSFAAANVINAHLADGSLVRLSFKPDESGRVSFTPPEVVMDKAALAIVNALDYAALPDGRFFAVLNEQRGPMRPVFQIVRNFTAEVEARLAKPASRP
jgi:eukaryotic-like serine/threonine-protein kinase